MNTRIGLAVGGEAGAADGQLIVSIGSERAGLDFTGLDDAGEIGGGRAAGDRWWNVVVNFLSTGADLILGGVDGAILRGEGIVGAGRAVGFDDSSGEQVGDRLSALGHIGGEDVIEA